MKVNKEMSFSRTNMAEKSNGEVGIAMIKE
jgi:hypothetical protein